MTDVIKMISLGEVERFAAQIQSTREELLTTLAVAYRPPDQHYVADRICPPIDVPHAQFAHMEWDTTLQRMLQSNEIAPNRQGSDSGGIGYVNYTASKVTDRTIKYGIAAMLDETDIEEFSEAEILEQANRAVATQMLLQRENRVVTLLQTTGNYPDANYYRTLSGEDQWNDHQNSSPESDVTVAKTQIIKNTGIAPNTIVIPWEVADELRQHPEVKSVLRDDARGKQSDAFDVDEDLNGLPSNLWGLTPVVPKVPYVSSNPGATEVNSFLWGKHVWIGFVNPSASRTEPSFSYTYTSSSLSIERGVFARPEGGGFLVGKERVLSKVVASRMGYLLQSAIA